MPEPMVLLVLLFVAGFSGWLDAVAGGGGILQLPSLIIAMPTMPLVSLLGSNKLVSVCGMSMAAITYGRNVEFSRRMAVVTGLVGCASAGCGAACALMI